MGRYMVITCRENIALGEKENEYVITHDGGLRYCESKTAAIAAIARQNKEWAREADPNDPRRVFSGVWDVKKGCWL